MDSRRDIRLRTFVRRLLRRSVLRQGGDVTRYALRDQRNLPRSVQRRRQSGKHCEVGVKRDALQAANAKRGKAVVVLEVPEQPLYRLAAPVEVAPTLGMAGDAREQPAAERERQRNLLAFRAAKRNDGFYAAFLALGVDARVVVALVHRTRLRLEA